MHRTAKGPDTPFDELGEPLARRVAGGLAKLGLAVRSQAWTRAGHRGLTPTQGQILATLARRGAQGLRLGELAEALGVTAATASDAVTALERKGLVRKDRATEDARALATTLTARGRREAAQASAWPDFLAEAVADLRPAEQEVLLGALVRMIRRLLARGEIRVAHLCVNCRFFQPDAHPGEPLPHHCALIDAPFADRHLRLDCPEHEQAPAAQARRAWRRFAGAR